MDQWAPGVVYAALVDNNEAMRWLEAAYQARFRWMPWIVKDAANAESPFYPVHRDQRFQVLRRRIQNAAAHP